MLGADVVEARQLRQALEPEDALEERRRAVADRAAAVVVAAGLGDQAALDEVRDGGVGGDAADARDVGPRARPEVRDDRERLERRLREVPLRRLLEEARARLRRLARRAERPAAGDVLEHDAAAALAVALARRARAPSRRARRRRPRPSASSVDGERRGGDDEQRLDRAGELVERVRCDQAERSVHAESFLLDVGFLPGAQS